MAGKNRPADRAPANSGNPGAGSRANPPESIPKVQKLLDISADLNQTVDMMQSAVTNLMEMDEIVYEVEEQRDSLKQALESQKKIEDELNLKIAKLEELNKRQKAKHAAAIRASWEKGRAQGRKEMKEEINDHLSSIGS